MVVVGRARSVTPATLTLLVDDSKNKVFGLAVAVQMQSISFHFNDRVQFACAAGISRAM